MSEVAIIRIDYYSDVTKLPLPFQSTDLRAPKKLSDHDFNVDINFDHPWRARGVFPLRSLNTPRVNRFLLGRVRAPRLGDVSVSDRSCSDRDIDNKWTIYNSKEQEWERGRERETSLAINWGKCTLTRTWTTVLKASRMDRVCGRLRWVGGLTWSTVPICRPPGKKICVDPPLFINFI